MTEKQKLKRIRNLVWYKEFNKLYPVVEKASIPEIMQLYFEILDAHGAFRYQWIALSAHRSLQQVLHDNDPKHKALQKMGLEH